ncbi:MAG TPA: ATP-dependent helicase [Anaerolineaceae bacterium]|nr:ATP-dependent helicase [Anaerolineaceae bacterium]HPN51082.1 ATP-dependent helicase [Anaerolineaceae bacterium]
MSINLTPEQQAVIHHPTGQHATVLAVAGSGKTTTLVYRIRHLVVDQKADPRSILVLMFNRLARLQFKERMAEVGIPSALRPRVETFHSYGYAYIESLVKRGLLTRPDYWFNEKEEEARRTLHMAINALEKSRDIPPESVDIEEALETISLWKGSLIPPSRAGCRSNAHLAAVYAMYEELRSEKHGLTFDDFVPLTVDILENRPALLNAAKAGIQHVIVDEYQDVNYGQQRLIELLAFDQADVMVVGDDDQTIYEWRGARPEFITRDFQKIFNNKPHQQYILPHSFRFGPLLAQCASNTIRNNSGRVAKPLVSFDITRPSNLTLVESQSANEKTLDASTQIASEIISLVKEKGIPPSQIVVLCRMYAQLSSTEAEFIQRGIPFVVDGEKPFYARREVCVLLDYLRLAALYRKPISAETITLMLNVLNTPSRLISRDVMRVALLEAQNSHPTLAAAMEFWVTRNNDRFYTRQQDHLWAWMAALQTALSAMQQNPPQIAADVLSTLVAGIGYLDHFDHYYGKGETAFEHKQSVLHFIDHARQTGLTCPDFLSYITSLDTTRGAGPANLIRLTTIYRVKGLEFDVVFIPDCSEGYLPCLFPNEGRIFDTARQIDTPEPSDAIENERRLFYVALTRARQAVYIGISRRMLYTREQKLEESRPSRFIDEVLVRPTVDVMNRLQQLASGETGAAESLTHAVKKHGGAKPVMNALLDYYLPALNQPILAKKLASLAAAIPEQLPALPPQTKPRPSSLHSSWDRVKK